MPYYVVARRDADAVEQVVRYSTAPPQRVLDAYARQGLRLVRVGGPGSDRAAREITRHAAAYRIGKKGVEKR